MTHLVVENGAGLVLAPTIKIRKIRRRVTNAIFIKGPMLVEQYFARKEQGG